MDDNKRFKDLDIHLQRLIKTIECLCFLPIGCYALYLRVYPYKYVPEQDLPTINL